MVVRAEALREAHRAKTQFDMDAFLTCVAKWLALNYLNWIEIILSEKQSEEWFRSKGFNFQITSYNEDRSCCWTVYVAPAYIKDVLTELVVQGYNVYTRGNDSFAVSLYQYPSNNFGGTIIHRADETFKY